MVVRRVVTLFAILACVNVALFVIERLLYAPFSVPSESMSPALRAGDRILVDRTVGFGDIERGDMVVFHAHLERRGEDFDASEAANSDALVKRVIGLPGETVQGSEQVIAVDRFERLEEPWADWGEDRSSFGPVELAEDELWVMGDNRDDSRDSRRFGAVPRDAVIGVVRARYWPFGRREAF